MFIVFGTIPVLPCHLLELMRNPKNWNVITIIDGSLTIIVVACCPPYSTTKTTGRPADMLLGAELHHHQARMIAPQQLTPLAPRRIGSNRTIKSQEHLMERKGMIKGFSSVCPLLLCVATMHPCECGNSVARSLRV